MVPPLRDGGSAVRADLMTTLPSCPAIKKEQQVCRRYSDGRSVDSSDIQRNERLRARKDREETKVDREMSREAANGRECLRRSDHWKIDGPAESELLHAASEGTGIHPELRRSSIRPIDPPMHGLQYSQDVPALDVDEVGC